MVIETQKRAKLGVDGLLCLLAAPIGYSVFFGVAGLISNNYQKAKAIRKAFAIYDADGHGLINWYGLIYGSAFAGSAFIISFILGVILLFVLHHRPPLKHRGALRAACLLIPALALPFWWYSVIYEEFRMLLKYKNP